jgi:hypothetical protein
VFLQDLSSLLPASEINYASRLVSYKMYTPLDSVFDSTFRGNETLMNKVNGLCGSDDWEAMIQEAFAAVARADEREANTKSNVVPDWSTIVLDLQHEFETEGI